MIKSESTKIPPAPTPCIERPKSAVPMSPEMAVMSEPTIKRVRPVSSMGLRPKISVKAEKSGMKAVAVMMKAMPSQNTLTAGPCNATAIVCAHGQPLMSMNGELGVPARQWILQ